MEKQKREEIDIDLKVEEDIMLPDYRENHWKYLIVENQG